MFTCWTHCQKQRGEISWNDFVVAWRLLRCVLGGHWPMPLTKPHWQDQIIDWGLGNNNNCWTESEWQVHELHPQYSEQFWTGKEKIVDAYVQSWTDQQLKNTARLAKYYVGVSNNVFFHRLIFLAGKKFRDKGTKCQFGSYCAET